VNIDANPLSSRSFPYCCIFLVTPLSYFKNNQFFAFKNGKANEHRQISPKSRLINEIFKKVKVVLNIFGCIGKNTIRKYMATAGRLYNYNEIFKKNGCEEQ